jgi:hypothetical protein
MNEMGRQSLFTRKKRPGRRQHILELPEETKKPPKNIRTADSLSETPTEKTHDRLIVPGYYRIQMKVPARERDGEQRTLYNGRLRDFISTI